MKQSRLGLLALLSASAAGPACNGVRFGAAAPTSEQVAVDTLTQRSLALPNCRGAADLADLGQVFVFSMDTPSQVSGGVPGEQVEHLVRQGVASLCIDGDLAVAQLLTCALVRTPVSDPSGDCASLLPSAALLANLEVARLRGTLDQSEPEPLLTLNGLDERWGLESGAAAPAELPAEPDDTPGVEDLDQDDAPGVTLKGDGDVPTEVWAVRWTQGSVSLVSDGDGRLEGRSDTVTVEVVLGGPASRAVAGRLRKGAQGDAVFVRADGLSGSPRADANRDGLVTCGEGAAYFGALPGFPTARCE